MSEENNSESSEQEPENFKIVSDGVIIETDEDVAAELEKQDENELDISYESEEDHDNEEPSDEESSDNDESLDEEQSDEEQSVNESDEEASDVEESDEEESDGEEDSESEESEDASDADESGSSANTEDSVNVEEDAMPAPQAQTLAVDLVLNKNAEIEKKIFGDADKYLQEASANFSEKKCSINMDDLNILLTFETGQQSLTFREFQTVKPGFIFQGNNPIDVPVDIKANGRTIGRGQLIEVGGRIGVQVMELF